MKLKNMILKGITISACGWLMTASALAKWLSPSQWVLTGISFIWIVIFIVANEGNN